MKELNELILPDDLRYAPNHEWVRLHGDTAIIGISDYAQDQLGEIVYVEFPKAGEKFKKGSEFGTLESVKAVSAVYMPVGGEILSVNQGLEESPELINTAPYDEGWLIEIQPDNPSEINALLTRDAYLKMLAG